uniref:Protein kinase domain-containing protein n=1 Tax=Rhizophagus irregularis (strain DAOM 181602 / DAOM 197198 / MUCL 43194) TaxID=747089 RepID=U9UI19_RHIID
MLEEIYITILAFGISSLLFFLIATLYLDERRKKYKNYDYILYEKCKQEINYQVHYYLNCYYNKIKRYRMKYHGSLKVKIFEISDYDLNKDERQEKYKDYYVLLCEKCNQEVNKRDYKCNNCYNMETDPNEFVLDLEVVKNVINIKYIAKGGFAKVYSAEWIDGRIKRWNPLSNNWERNGQTKIALKVLNDSENISEDFLNESSLKLLISIQE